MAWQAEPLDMVLCVSTHTSIDDDLYYNLSHDGNDESYASYLPEENKAFICRTAQGDASIDSGPSAARYQFSNVSEVATLLHQLAETSQKNIQQEMAALEAVEALRQELRDQAGIDEASSSALESDKDPSHPTSALTTPGLGPIERDGPSGDTTPAPSNYSEPDQSPDIIIPSALKSWSELKSTILEHKHMAVFINFEGTLVEYESESGFDPGYAWKRLHKEVLPHTGTIIVSLGSQLSFRVF